MNPVNPLAPTPSFYILRRYFNQGRRNVKGQSPKGLKVAMAKNLIFSVHILSFINIKILSPLFIYF